MSEMGVMRYTYIVAAYSTKDYHPTKYFGPFESKTEAREYADRKLRGIYVAIVRVNKP
jgi:hypothetical protein